MPIPSSIPLPLGLVTASQWLGDVDAQSTLSIVVPADYESQLLEMVGSSEVLLIQRLLTMARRGAHFHVEWAEGIAGKVLAGPSIFPLLCVLLMQPRSSHRVSGGVGADVNFARPAVRREILRHRLARDLFADSDMAMCVDGEGDLLPEDLYLPGSLKLRPREDFETLMVDALTAQVGNAVALSTVYKSASALGVVLAELFENTDMHGKLDQDGKPLGEYSLRGVIFKRIKIELPVLRPPPGAAKVRTVDCFEVSVFDSGIGYFDSYTRQQTSLKSVPLIDEWKVLHNCLERHYYPELSDLRAGHRALGLYEVLRIVQALKGRVEIRTGRLFAYRTFLDGELQAQMRPKAKFAHIAWPVPRLLDVEKKYTAQPSEHEVLVGSSVRIVVPLNG